MEKVREHEVNLSSALTVFRNSVFLFVYVSRSTSSCRKPNCSIVIRKYMWNLFLIPVQFYDVHLTFRVPWCSEFILFVGSYKSSYNLQFFFRIRSKRAFTIHFIQHNARVIGNIRWPYECTCTGGRLTSYGDVTKRIIRQQQCIFKRDIAVLRWLRVIRHVSSRDVTTVCWRVRFARNAFDGYFA